VSASSPNDNCALPGTPLANAAAGLDACVHCGFCLQSCPTYVTLDDENDSPRGRLMLMRGLLEGEIPIDDPSLETHLDRCLGCRACETVCPSGVPYGHLLEATRETMAPGRRLPLVARAILTIFARPVLMRVMMWGARLARASGLSRLLSTVSGRLGFAFAMLESTRIPLARRRYVASGSGARGRVAVLQGCVMRGLFSDTNAATARTLIVNDYEIVPAPSQGCCGALHVHAGQAEAARELARRNILAFERSGADFIAVNASGCGAAMKEYGLLLAGDPLWVERARAVAARVRDVSELLAAAGPAAGGNLTVVAAYDAPCHLHHAQRVTAAPYAVLNAVRGLRLVPLANAEQCCGSAGIYNLIEPEVSDAVLKPKLAHIEQSGAALVATGNPGCLMQIGAGLIQSGQQARVIHPVDLLDAAYAESAPGPRR
jgi:glycolate oxidase iron-sulfur subunit